MSSASVYNVPTESVHSSAGFRPQKMRIGKTVISGDLKPSLEKFLLTSNHVNDRRKALEMLTYIDDSNRRYAHENTLLKEYKLKKCLQRPRTAHAKLYRNSSLQRFSTTYNEYFPVRELNETIATRPPSTENMIARANNAEETAAKLQDNLDISYTMSHEVPQKNLSVYDTKTTYNNDYCSSENTDQVRLNPNTKAYSQRAATSSGSRCHNPHPSQAFLVWRYPREFHNNNTSRVPSETVLKSNMENNFAHITDEQFDKVMRGNCRSTYQSDYVGGSYPDSRITPFYIQPAIQTGEKLKISTQRIDYKTPQSLPMELTVPVDRYKSNKTKYHSAQGIIPDAVNKVYMATNARTTYDEDINDRAQVIYGQIVNDVQRKVDLSRVHNMKALEKAMLGARNIDDKEALSRIFQKLNEPDDYKRKSFVRKPFYNNDKPCWTSNWPGPL